MCGNLKSSRLMYIYLLLQLLELGLNDMYDEDVTAKLKYDDTAFYLDLANSLQSKCMLQTSVRHMRNISSYLNCVKHLELMTLFEIEFQPCLLLDRRVHELKHALITKMCTMIYRYFVSQRSNVNHSLFYEPGPSLNYCTVSLNIMKLFVGNATETRCAVKTTNTFFWSGWHIPDLSEVIIILKEWVEFDLERRFHVDSLCAHLVFGVEDIKTLCEKRLILSQSMKDKLFRIIKKELDYNTSQIEINEHYFHVCNRSCFLGRLRKQLDLTQPLFS